jgi:pimeloyl-ACP methyl ester carboxylesterase
MEMHQLFVNDKKVVYHLYGQGKPVILLHGFGEDHSVWQNQVSYFSDQYLLILPDLPGTGHSFLTHDMSIEGMADIVKLMLDEVAKGGMEPVYFIGHSMGGYVALAFTEKYPELVGGLGLFHSTAYADNLEKIKTRKKGIEFIETHGAQPFLKSTLPNLFSDNTKAHNPELIELLLTRAGNFSASALVSYYEAMINRPDRTNVIANINIPVLFMISENDVAIPLADSIRQTILPLKSYITILKKSGHMGMLEEPEASNQALGQFLENSS